MHRIHFVLADLERRGQIMEVLRLFLIVQIDRHHRHQIDLLLHARWYIAGQMRNIRRTVQLVLNKGLLLRRHISEVIEQLLTLAPAMAS